jgi:hypothetical protein
MIDDLKRRLGVIEARKNDVLARVGALAEAERTRRPSPGDWSPQEIVEHLVLYEELLAGWIAAAGSAPEPKKRRGGLPALFVPVITRIMRWGVRIPTLPELLPRGEASLEELERRWAGVRAALTDRLGAIPPGAAGAPIALHPIAGPLDAVAVLRLADAHLVYHQRQIERRKKA